MDACRLRLLAGVLLVGSIVPGTGPVLAADPGLGVHESANTGPVTVAVPARVRTYRQFDPGTDVADVYVRTSGISFALASVPDPRVPRHRRAYDLAIIAIMQGMQDRGYSLDRFAFPWQAVLSGDEGNAGGEGMTTDDCRYGVMLFRRDLWRGNPRAGAQGAAPAIHALYVVPETATYGVPMRSAHAAMQRILAQTGKLPSGKAPGACKEAKEEGDPEGEAEAEETAETAAEPDSRETPAPSASAPSAETAAAATAPTGRLARHALCDTPSDYVLLSGPTFSGSVDSIAQLNARAVGEGGPPLCAVSPSATAASNRAVTGGAASTGLRFHSLAVSDDAKLAALWDMAGRIGARGRNSSVVILYDTSLFGSEVCPVDRHEPAADCAAGTLDERGRRQCLCRNSHRISYPSNIADVRAALQPEVKEDESLTKKVALGKYLPLDHGAGNGSEFPDGRQSRLTATGAYLQLQRIMGVLKNLDPRLVIVVGTDVRDRMFLFEQLREGLPSAQLADLEADTLSNHPQYIHATRGAVLTASERIAWFTAPPGSGVVMEVGATDLQVLQRALVRGIDAAGWHARTELPTGCAFSHDQGPVMHVVGRKALLPLLCPTPKERWLRLRTAPALALASFALLLLGAPLSRNSGALARTGWLGRWSLGCYHRLRHVAGGYDPTLNRSTGLVLLALLLMLLLALVLQNRVLAAIVLVVGPAYSWAISYLAGAYDTLSGRATPQAKGVRRLRDTVRMHPLAAAAILLAAVAAALWLFADEFGKAVMVRLGFAAHAGMALCIAVMLAVLVLLLADSALAVARGASRRNEAVVLHALGLAHESGERGRLRRMFRCPLCPASTVMAVGMIALALCVLYAVPVKLTVFGAPASVLALVCVIAMSYVSLLFLVTAIRMRQRATRVAALVKDAVLAAGNGAAGETEAGVGALGLWPPEMTPGVRFASTPAVARVKDGGRHAIGLLAPACRQEFAQALRTLSSAAPAQADAGQAKRDARLALFALLASEVSQVRWATFSGVAACLAVAGFVYLYPVSGADAFMLFNLAVLSLAGLFAGHTAMSLERNEVMSNLLCNRSAKMEWSGTLFNYIALPFVVLTIVIAITQIPGVINLGGGMFDSTLKELASTLFGGL